ncbi:MULTISPECIES: class I SAM-dependent methyltransferase [unclassified Methylobacterium]|uniref:class I SAM-dependent methyltransferase n=1 Tax=unclassified Methylobacterium TaxID=2615210 RepID=UPI001AED813F|nr:class I SAM-dependent methyltransferase [Methylobacterium sp. 2A]
MHDEFSLVVHGDSKSTLSATLVEFAFAKSMALQHRLPNFVLGMRGMSGRKYRSFINNLIALVPNARYFEVGSWAGSTACAAMYGNKAKITCIDNWSQFGGPRNQFLENVERCSNENIDFQLIESDFREVNYSQIGKYNVYLFDGPHLREDQRDGIVLGMPALDREFILIVDDWNWAEIREGTFAGIQAGGLALNYCMEIKTTQNGSHASVPGERGEWHNGYFIGVLTKP